MNDDRPTRYSLDEHVHLYDRSKSVPRLVKSAHLQEFLFENSDLKALAECSARYPCRRRICPWCARLRVAAKTRRETRDIASTYDRVLEVVLTSKSHASLAEAFSAQRRARSKFMSNAWLTQRTDAWMRETEITVREIFEDESGWHVHDHYLLFLESDDPEELRELGRMMIARWLDSARRAGVQAYASGQEATLHHGTRERLLYVTKGNMTQKQKRTATTGYSPADVLAMYVAGETRGQAWWSELEGLFSTRLRWRASSGLKLIPDEDTAEPSLEIYESQWRDLLDSEQDPQEETTSSPSPRPPRENRNARDREHLQGLYEGVSSASTQYEVYLAMKAEEKRAHDAEQARLDFWRTHHRAPLVAYNGNLS